MSQPPVAKRAKMADVQPKNGPSPAGGTVLMWFRISDLRVQDNTALHNASQHATSNNLKLMAMFVVSPVEWAFHDVAPVRVDFILRNLHVLKQKLGALAIPLDILQDDGPVPDEHIPRNQRIAEINVRVADLVAANVARWNAKAVFWNKEYEIDETFRDDLVKSRLMGTALVCDFHDQCAVPPGICKTGQGGPYTVFTPYRNRWTEVATRNPAYLTVLPSPQANTLPLPEPLQMLLDAGGCEIPELPSAFKVEQERLEAVRLLFPAGEDHAVKLLQDFISTKLDRYKDQRDLPAADGTSTLSPYFSLGVISARRCVSLARAANGNKMESGKAGAVQWISEVCWRDFYRNILVEFPKVCKGRPFKPETDKLAWSYDKTAFQAWCEGKTGFPIVDAGMRQLNATGWMHNRLRMIVASFLTKDLLIDWRMGEEYFMKSLIDGDFASNNGGWQWTASTGTDAQPYFRIFNPFSQSERFDPNGQFIAKWVPELAGLKGTAAIHDPFSKLDKKAFQKLNYPKPMVDHKVARQKAIQAFKALKS
ncbi:deoxyribodipyrimidine photolyase [Polychytrium aggregatum]|uniref:deoxyribodipyrimidine photolyase n=1 Tax=Polychytrium aggregatum TaxID=110093 RepID=UPI0022FDEB13|nr:deoxyribodipyrimidine photolyase [Polychytrium aggregatum]KAI9206775.1 deoxyribodipyrimidine photolyase [Polychytrium aggregatum]